MKRRWLQLRLSTCIALMFVAGILLWLNLHALSRLFVTGWEKASDGSIDPQVSTLPVYGWPLPCIN